MWLLQSKQSSLEAPYPPGMSSEDMSLNSDHGVHEQLLRERAMLKQRKISTQLNVGIGLVYTSNTHLTESTFVTEITCYKSIKILASM